MNICTTREYIIEYAQCRIYNSIYDIVCNGKKKCIFQSCDQ